MSKLHHMVKAAAVAKYSKLVAAEASREEVMSAVAADEKAFDADSINEIMEALYAPASPGTQPEGNSSIPPPAKQSSATSNYITCEEWRMERENGVMVKLKKVRDNVKLTDQVYAEYNQEERRKVDTVQYFPVEG